MTATIDQSGPSAPPPTWFIACSFGLGAAGFLAFVVFAVLSIINRHDVSVGNEVAQFYQEKSAALQSCVETQQGQSSACVEYRRLKNTPMPRNLVEYEKKNHIGQYRNG
ncbi:hypothetical protein [Burkholderia stabilis]|uniref:hypothetical protein n=1 Tax=Burkholderia stabilis TaxID=95485 RepID=UPI001F4BC984|nr:hypothetical protein [Burkholderia stabilis]